MNQSKLISIDFDPSIVEPLSRVITTLDICYFENDYCIAGGSIMNYLDKYCNIGLNLNSSDIDIFLLQRQYMIKTYRFFHLNYVTPELYKGCLAKDETVKVDLVMRPEKWENDPKNVIDSFDFVCCQAYYFNNKIYYYENMLEDLANKRLNGNNLTAPYAVLNRIQRYSNKGFRITDTFARDFVDLINTKDIEELDLRYSFSNHSSFYGEYDEANQNDNFNF